MNIGTSEPKPKESRDFYSPTGLATDATDHMAVLLRDTDASGNWHGPLVIAAYTSEANGELTTTSTFENMPAASLIPQGSGGTISVSPSGKLLVVYAAGGNGFEVFNFDGGNPITKSRLMSTSEPILQASWDKNNHLYVTEWNGETGRLYVYTVTPTRITEAPGSPYSTPYPLFLLVHSL